jgi:hypothetical protein
VHTDEKAAASARSEGALAYTSGLDLIFGQGKYAPGTPEGRRLLAHELTHVVQQSTFGQPNSMGAIADAFEREAEEVSNTITKPRFPAVRDGLAPLSTPPIAGRAIQRSPDPDIAVVRNEKKLEDLARDPRDAHEAWKGLKTDEKAIVVDKMAQRYGATFAHQFREVAEHGKAEFVLTYWQPHTGPSPEHLRAAGWRLLGMEVTGTSWIEIEIWVNPVGHTIRRDVSPDQVAPKQQPIIEPPPCPMSEFADDLKKSEKDMWPAVADYEAKVELLESNPAAVDRPKFEEDISKAKDVVFQLLAHVNNLWSAAGETDDDCAVDVSWDLLTDAWEEYTRINQRYKEIKQPPSSGSNANP